jgi:hypothetical protein
MSDSITINIADSELIEIVNYELDGIRTLPEIYNLGRTPLCPREFEAHDHRPEDTLGNMLDNGPVRPFRGGN